MTRVLMLTCQYMPDVFGGAEKQCQRVAQELHRRGHHVQVLTSTARWDMRGAANEDGVHVTRIFTGVAPDLLGRWILFSLYWFLRALWWSLRHRRSFDVLHCHQGKFGAFVATATGCITRRPVLIKIGNSEQDMDLLCLRRKALVGRPFSRFVVGRRPWFVAISQVIERNLRDFGCRDVIAIPNGIPARKHSVAPTGRTRPAAGPHFFYHGRIEPIKRVETLLDAFNLVAARCPDARLHLVGDGSALAGLKEHCKSLSHLADRVEFHGEVKDPLDFIDAFDIFVNASRAEGFSNSLLEALVLGKVLVSTPVSGTAEAILGHRNGCVSRDFTAAQLAEAMLTGIAIFNTASPEVAATSRELVDRKFAMPVVVQQYEVLYTQMIQGLRT